MDTPISTEQTKKSTGAASTSATNPQVPISQSISVAPTSLQSLSSASVEYVVEKLIAFQGNAQRPLLNEFTMEFVMMLLEKDKLSQIEAKFSAFSKEGVDIVEFVKIFLYAIPHKPHELIYITIALIDLFKSISETLALSLTLTFNNVTSFLCDYFVEKNIQTYPLPTVKMPEQRKFLQNAQNTTTIDENGNIIPPNNPSNSALQIRQIDIDPTVIQGRTDDLLKRLVPNSVLTDSSKHNNHCITAQHKYIYLSGAYSRADNRVITLDSLATEVKLYKLTNKLERTITTSPDKSKQTIIMSFAYSQREQRIGATLKDISMVFWDKVDSYKFQKRFIVSSMVCDYQRQIWYLESQRLWVTTDKSNALHIWNLDEEKITKSLVSPLITTSIICLAEITHVHLVGVASLDKLITVWDLQKEILHFQIDLSIAGVHHFVYSYSYQSIISAGFENCLRVYNVSAKYLDSDYVGSLLGHTSMVTAVQTVEKTPMVISSDDLGYIKVWDIRSLSCVQTFSIGYRTTMTKIISIPEEDMICLLGTRVNFIHFDTKHQQQSQATNKKVGSSKASDEIFPIKVEYNPKKDEMAICTRKDVRFLRISDGKLNRILTGLLASNSDEITTFGYMNQYQNFILGDQQGTVTVYNTNTGDRLNSFPVHSNEVSSIHFDNTNKLLISSSMDSSIAINEWLSQSQTLSSDLELEQKRRILNAHSKKPINVLSISLYHNIIVTTSSESFIYVFDFEFVKLIGCIQIDKGSEPTAVIILPGFPLLFISTNIGFIYVLRFGVAEFKLSLDIIAAIDINEVLAPPKIPNQNEDEERYSISNYNSNQNKSENRTSVMTIKNLNRTITIDPNLANSSPQAITTTALGAAAATPSDSILTARTSPKTKKSMVATNSQPRKTFKNAVNTIQSGIALKQIREKKIKQQQQQSMNPLEKEASFEGSQMSSDDELEEDALPSEWCTKILEEVDEQSSKKVLRGIRLYASTNKGRVLVIALNLDDPKLNIKFVEHANVRVNYNAKRTYTEDFLTSYSIVQSDKISIRALIKHVKEIQMGQVDECQLFYFFHLGQQASAQSGTSSNSTINRGHLLRIGHEITLLREFNAHKDMLTTFNFVELSGSKQCLLTSASDGYVRIWDKVSGALLGNVNVNHPLPVAWSIVQDQYANVKQRLFYAMKIIDVIRLKYRKDPVNALVNTVDDFLTTLLPEVSAGEKSIQETVQAAKGKRDGEMKGKLKGIQVMKDEYTPRDIKFNEVEHIYASELRGISLKQMEAKKRLRELAEEQISFSEKEPSDQPSSFKANEAIKLRKQQEVEIVQFLSDHWRNRLTNLDSNENGGGGSSDPYNSSIPSSLRRKLDNKARELILHQRNLIPRTQHLLQQPGSGSVGIDNSSPTTQLSIEPLKSVQTFPHSAHAVTTSAAGPAGMTSLQKSINPLPLQNLQKQSISLSTTPPTTSKHIRAQQKQKHLIPRTVDFIDYAINKHYLPESSESSQLHLTTTTNTDESALSNGISFEQQSTRRSVKKQDNSQILGDTQLTNRSTLLMNPLLNKSSSSHTIHQLQKAQINEALKNINEKLKKSRYNQDSSLISKSSSLSARNPHDRMHTDETQNITITDQSALAYYNTTTINTNRSQVPAASTNPIKTIISPQIVQKSPIIQMKFLDALLNEENEVKNPTSKVGVSSDRVIVKLPFLPVMNSNTRSQNVLVKKSMQSNSSRQIFTNHS